MSGALVAGVEMGYGHLRAARALADALGTKVTLVDRAPVAGKEEQRLWRASRRFYEITSRASQLPLIGAPLEALLEAVTSIPPLYPHRDLSAPTFQSRSLGRFIDRGLGRGLARHLLETGAPLVSTFFAPALAAERFGVEEIYCVATDVDLNRTWAPREPSKTRINYLAPTRRARRRLIAYGVPRERIEVTGFPLPAERLGGEDLPTLRRDLAARLVRLDPKGVFREQVGSEIDHFLGALRAEQEGRPPLAVFAVGGAGAQADLAAALLPSLRPLIEQGRLRLTLVAGIRREVAARFALEVRAAGLESCLAPGIESVHGAVPEQPVSILLEADHDTYFDRFHALLGEADLLFTKPSEMVFFGALGLPLVLTRPVGVHERYNRRWAVENGAGLKMRDPHQAGDWLREYLTEGTLAAAAWFGYLRLPKFGLYRILERIGRGQSNVT
ncbi:MAG TPA: hypothetical protein VGS22_18935 [Thermoanaerobaculia bacterium]|jgi:hypothetical protein|nr:hypothetical protein [Thermoanaerobaculia bacterium]